VDASNGHGYWTARGKARVLSPRSLDADNGRSGTTEELTPPKRRCLQHGSQAHILLSTLESLPTASAAEGPSVTVMAKPRTPSEAWHEAKRLINQAKQVSHAQLSYIDRTVTQLREIGASEGQGSPLLVEAFVQRFQVSGGLGLVAPDVP
jgi:hypothetical protein